MNTDQNIVIKNGDIYMAELPDDADGSLQSGTRPVIIVSNNLANKHSPVITVIPMTAQMSKKKLPTHAVIENCGLEKKSIVLAEQIMSINKKNLERKMGTISETVYESKVKKAMKVQLGL